MKVEVQLFLLQRLLKFFDGFMWGAGFSLAAILSLLIVPWIVRKLA